MTAATSSRPALRLAATTLLLLGALVLLVAFCEFFTSVGGASGIDPQPEARAQIALPNRRTHLQAEAFLAGQSHLLVKPDPRLLAVLDDAARRGAEVSYPLRGDFHYLWDELLHEGKYYNYWGPLPALVVAACYGIVGRGFEIKDRVVGKWFGVLCILALGLLVLRIRRAFHPGFPFTLTCMFIVTALTMHPLPFCLARPYAYEVAILSGQFFVLSGFCGLVSAFAGRNSRVELWAAGAAFACAVACRFSLVVPLGAVLVVTGWQLRAWPRRDLIRAAAALLAPSIGVVVALLCHNFARFGHPLDFGVDYQLGVGRFRTGPDYVPANLWNHMFRLPRITDFPYLDLQPTRALYPGFVARPDHYYDEESTVGALYAMPMLWLIPVSAVCAIVRRRRGERDSPRGSNAFIAALGAFAAVSFAMLLLLWAAVVRYALDYSLILLVMAFFASAFLYQRLGSRAWRVAWILAAALLAALTSFIGINYGFEAPWSFQMFHPSLYGFYRSLF